jgi:dTDP-4-dehydrorhamnose 3,5-epimerase-like enzyme
MSEGSKKGELQHLIKHIPISRFIDDRGQLSVLEPELGLPFTVRRLYWISGVPENESRGKHGHKELEQVFVCLMGSFSLMISNGSQSETVLLSEKSDAVYVPKEMWRELSNFSDSAVCLVLASRNYDTGDYLNSMEDFLSWILRT